MAAALGSFQYLQLMRLELADTDEKWREFLLKDRYVALVGETSWVLLVRSENLNRCSLPRQYYNYINRVKIMIVVWELAFKIGMTYWMVTYVENIRYWHILPV